ncbi:hypothetical protein O3M35_011550 [Rhynocoris fuscipes]|uniref:Uncharacterized protein n=1 Tax=Rhynocoris fuscipes TaxID=488301 RepID=A0AAW1CWM5_9HEMI
MPFSAEIFAELIAAQVQAQLKAIYLTNRNTMNGKRKENEQNIEMADSTTNLDDFNRKVKMFQVPEVSYCSLADFK